MLCGGELGSGPLLLGRHSTSRRRQYEEMRTMIGRRRQSKCTHAAAGFIEKEVKRKTKRKKEKISIQFIHYCCVHLVCAVNVEYFNRGAWM